MIHSILYKKVNQSQLINEITNMVVSNKVESVVTYNYDDLIEIELSKKGVPPDFVNASPKLRFVAR